MKEVDRRHKHDRMDRGRKHGGLTGGDGTATPSRDRQENARAEEEEKDAGDEVEYFYYIDRLFFTIV